LEKKPIIKETSMELLKGGGKKGGYSPRLFQLRKMSEN